VNDEIAETAARFDLKDGSDFEFICECGEPTCHRFVRMTLAQYRGSEPGSVIAH
jgi:hypothetical protein